MKRYFVPGILAALCLAGSSYIVLESAGYYRKLYILAGLSGFMGWYTAVLSEVFQLALVMLLPAGKESQVKRLSLLAIIVLIYTMTIFAAGMNIGKPLIEKWSQSKNQVKLLSILLEERKVLNGHVKRLHNQNQKLNTVMTIQAERESFREIKSHLENENPVDSMLIQTELAALWLLRILIQLANLFCGRIIAISWKLNKLESSNETQMQSQERMKAKVVRKWKAKYTREENGFIGIMKLDNGQFVAVSPDKKRKYRTFQGALNFFQGTPFQEKINKEPSWEIRN